jgi:hypothetical protein
MAMFNVLISARSTTSPFLNFSPRAGSAMITSRRARAASAVVGGKFGAGAGAGAGGRMFVTEFSMGIVLSY